jgi:hypothetical protein
MLWNATLDGMAVVVPRDEANAHELAAHFQYGVRSVSAGRRGAAGQWISYDIVAPDAGMPVSAGL